MKKVSLAPPDSVWIYYSDIYEGVRRKGVTVSPVDLREAFYINDRWGEL